MNISELPYAIMRFAIRQDVEPRRCRSGRRPSQRCQMRGPEFKIKQRNAPRVGDEFDAKTPLQDVAGQVRWVFWETRAASDEMRSPPTVIPGLDPGIHVDGRVKPGDDG